MERFIKQMVAKSMTVIETSSGIFYQVVKYRPVSETYKAHRILNKTGRVKTRPSSVSAGRVVRSWSSWSQFIADPEIGQMGEGFTPPRSEGRRAKILKLFL